MWHPFLAGSLTKLGVRGGGGAQPDLPCLMLTATPTPSLP